METIEIRVLEYYDNSRYYRFMPEVVFDALEAAFLDGRETALVHRVAFDEMLKEFNQ
jgi:hypothetical protein